LPFTYKKLIRRRDSERELYLRRLHICTIKYNTRLPYTAQQGHDDRLTHI